jgi:hypothetical protein
MLGSLSRSDVHPRTTRELKTSRYHYSPYVQLHKYEHKIDGTSTSKDTNRSKVDYLFRVTWVIETGGRQTQ